VRFRDQVFWFGLGLIASFWASIFLSFWPVAFWLLALAWWERGSLWLVFAIGLIYDLLLLEPLGKTPLIGLLTILLIRAIKRVLSINWPKSATNFQF